MPHHINTLIVGAGNMAQAYFKILQSFHIAPYVLCRSQETANTFFEKTGYKAIPGGLKNWLSQNPLNENWNVIIATPIEHLAENIIDLLNAGAKNILVEKPGFLTLEQGHKILELCNQMSAKVHIAYNRRFYSSVFEAEKIIQKDGGITSIQFEFTEWSHIIEPLKKGPLVKERWFLSNSTHVVDLAFFLGGRPQEYHFYTKGGNNWHPSATNFVGSGITDKDILFSYASNWEAPGRWAVEILTKEHRLYLKPMEKLQIQAKGSVQIQNVEIDETLDLEYKPGLYAMTKALLEKEFTRFIDIQGQINNFHLYYQMANYKDE